MGIKFTPTSRDDLKKPSEILPDGWYEAEITEAEPAKAESSGNDMLNLTIKVYKPDGNTWNVWDYLVFTPKAMWKVAECADACGAGQKYDDGELGADDLIGNLIQVKIGTKAATEQYAAKNVVKSYAAPTKSRPAKPDARPVASKPAGPVGGPAYTPVGEDDIPF